MSIPETPSEIPPELPMVPRKPVKEPSEAEQLMTRIGQLPPSRPGDLYRHSFRDVTKITEQILEGAPQFEFTPDVQAKFKNLDPRWHSVALNYGQRYQSLEQEPEAQYRFLDDSKSKILQAALADSDAHQAFLDFFKQPSVALITTDKYSIYCNKTATQVVHATNAQEAQAACAIALKEDLIPKNLVSHFKGNSPAAQAKTQQQSQASQQKGQQAAQHVVKQAQQVAFEISIEKQKKEHQPEERTAQQEPSASQPSPQRSHRLLPEEIRETTSVFGAVTGKEKSKKETKESELQRQKALREKDRMTAKELEQEEKGEKISQKERRKSEQRRAPQKPL